ncbi:MAG TPA: class I SAM-dependent methyltransferase [Candidatus Saccharimonadia bacterium]|jgi:cyclopropane-fatty-acyl-phospholipid synthase
MTPVNIVLPNGCPLPFFGGPDAPTVRFTRWRDVLALPLWPTYVFGVGFSEGRILVGDHDLDTILAGQGNASTVITWWLRFWALFRQLPALRRGTRQRHIEAHYDKSNRYYIELLSGQLGGPGDGVGVPGDMSYSCARPLTPSEPIRRAQLRKMLDIFMKLGLYDQGRSTFEGRWLVDIGCGWGDLAVLAAQLFGLNVLGLTLSPAQAERARSLATACGVGHLVTIEVMNYLDLSRSPYAHLQADYVTSVGMFEHVDRRSQRRFFQVVQGIMKPSSTAVLHCIVRQVPGPLDLWVRKRIFPRGHLSTPYRVERLLARHGLFTAQTDFLWEEYAVTLEHWLEMHVANRQWTVTELGEQFYLERLLWLKGSIQAFQRGGQPGMRQQGLKVGQWLFTLGKPEAGTWPLGHPVDPRLIERLLGRLAPLTGL